MGERALVVCPLFRREVDALEAAGMVDGPVETTPHRCDPSATERAALGAALASRAAGPALSIVLGGGCMHGVVRPLGPHLRVLAPPTCFELVAPTALVEHLVGSGAHLLTPGWLAQWRRAFGAWGLDHQTARELFAESARRLVLLDTGVDPDAAARLDELGAYLELPTEIVPIGLDVLALRLREVAGPPRPQAPSGTEGLRPSTQRRLADYGAVLDFTSRLASTVDEGVVVERLVELATALFVPEVVVFVPVIDGVPRAPVVAPAGMEADVREVVELTAFAGRAAVAEDGASMLVRVGESSTLGLLRLTRVAFPRFLEHYLDVAWLVAEATSLALLHARSHRALDEAREALRIERDELDARVRERTAELEHIVEELRDAATRIRVLQGLLPICCGCKKVRDDTGYWRAIEEYITQHSEATFSHGLCPDCMERLYPELADELPPSHR
jgi:hypothetical protein